MRTFFALVFTVVLSQLTGARIISVPSEQPTIQAGIDFAFDGDTVLAAAGTYTGEGNRDIDLLGKAIVVMSEVGPEYTVVDCQGDSLNPHRGFIFQNEENETTTIIGFSIINGYFYPGLTAQTYGGGILCVESSPTVIRCIIKRCTATNGGGISSLNGTPLFYECIIDSNNAVIAGGGVYVEMNSPRFISCSISHNQVVQFGNLYAAGGGMASINASAVVESTDFIGNYVYKTPQDLDIQQSIGGGIALFGGFGTFINCIIAENSVAGSGTSSLGGGAMAEGFIDLTFNRCIFIGNTAALFAGGVGIWDGRSVSFNGCVFQADSCHTNGTGALYAIEIDSVHVDNCTFTGNISDSRSSCIGNFNSRYFLEQSILAYNLGETTWCLEREYSPDIDVKIIPIMSYFPIPSKTVEISYPDNKSNEEYYSFKILCCDIYGNVGGDWTECIVDQAAINGNFSLDPHFCDIANGDFYLHGSSPCAPEHSGCGQLVGALDVNCQKLIGDANGDLVINMDDIYYMCAIHFMCDLMPDPFFIIDVNCDNAFNLVDIVYLNKYITGTGPPPCHSI